MIAGRWAPTPPQNTCCRATRVSSAAAQAHPFPPPPPAALLDLPAPSPLFTAVAGGHAGAVALLLAAGANPHVRYCGQSVLQCALATGGAGVLGELLRSGATESRSHCTLSPSCCKKSQSDWILTVPDF